MNNFTLMFLTEANTNQPILSPYFWVGAVILVLLIMVPWALIVVLWIFKRYRVRFFGFHGEVLSVKYYKKNTMFYLPTNPDIPGYIFDGWYEIDEEGNLKLFCKERS